MLSEQPFMKFEIREKVSNLKEEKSFRQLSSLELQPIVKIYESEQNIEISGYLVLNGEFIRDDVNEEWEEEYEESDGVHSGTIFEQPEEPLQFQYQIPISIQIQANRVTEPSQVFVDIDYFDYEVLSDEEMELIAHVRLLGVHPHVEQDTPVDWVEGDSDELESSVESLLEESTSSKEVFAHIDPVNQEDMANILDDDEKEEDEEQGEEKVTEVQEVVATDVQEVVATDVQEVEIEEQEITTEEQEVVQTIKEMEEPKTPKMKIGFKKKELDSTQNEIRSSNPLYSLLKREEPTPIVDEQPTETSTLDTVDEEVADQESISTDTDEEIAEESIQPNTSINKDNLIYSLLQDNKESRATITLYFVRKDDTLQSIAEKYSVKVQSVIEKNKLSSEEVREGQILYLPIGR
ncbi:LysM peptidoglycan-binding domain-containing protein [Tepidibacillus marianensis]|uniref:LysM peptidoglycan-binding domain-containing protein n=1 Tax=Tepidibacillus marianensis TaxID=3131995 RepID=UPI0030CEBE8F